VLQYFPPGLKFSRPSKNFLFEHLGEVRYSVYTFLLLDHISKKVSMIILLRLCWLY